MLPADFSDRRNEPHRENFVDTGDMKTPSNHFLVKTGTGLPPVTGLVNRQFKLIVKLNPVNQGSVALYYDAWEFF